ncbi:MAG: polysaccharide deacetylase family protein [candidate division KSB1 bacterium]|nr:polysaccharide deacetylase family protein [candidate division KSB1 bacterium]MDZ7345169.1 polysaccharide deacetylase family protein [candidate division KSB1 bacterium]
MGILVYHRVDPRFSLGVTNITPKLFARQIKAILRADLQIRTVGELVAEGLPSGQTALTFDDGYESVFLHAFPILQTEGIKASVFVNPAFTGQWNVWDVRLPGQRAKLMDWRQIEALAKADWEIGIHGLTHKDLCSLNDEELEQEINLARFLLKSRLGTCSSVISYPFGRVDVRVAQCCRKNGLTAGLTMSRSPKMVPPEFAVRRYGVYPFDTPNRTAVKAKSPTKGFSTLQQVMDFCSSATVVLMRRYWRYY